MADQPGYVKAAFKRQENLIALGGLCAAGALFNPGFLMLAGALEVAYLWVISTNQRFRRVVDSERGRAGALFDAKEKDRLLLRLPGAERERYLGLARIRQEVHDAWQSRDAVTQGLLLPSVDKLDYLLDTFLRAQLGLSLMRAHLAGSDQDSLARQVKSVEAEMRRELPDKLRDAKARSLDILRQRVARLAKLEEDMAVVRAQLDNIEHAVRLVSDQSISLSDPRQIAVQIEGAVAEVGQTERSIKEVESFLEAARQEAT